MSSPLAALTPTEESNPKLQRLQKELEDRCRVKAAEAEACKAAEEAAKKQKAEEDTAKKSAEKKHPREDDSESEVGETNWVAAR